MRLTPNELVMMKPLWDRGSASIRQIREALLLFPRPAYTTVQTTIHRLELKGAVRRVGRIRTANVFAPAVSRATVLDALVAQCVALADGRTETIAAHVSRILASSVRGKRSRPAANHLDSPGLPTHPVRRTLP